MIPIAAYPTEEELHAFIDDELPASRRAEIAAILLEDPALAARVTAFEADRDLLRMALKDIAEEPLPADWAARIEAAMASQRADVPRFVPRVVPDVPGRIPPAPPRATHPAALKFVPKVVRTRRFALAAGMALAASVALGVQWQAGRDETILALADAAREGQLDGRVASPDPLPPPAARDGLLRATLGMSVKAPDLEKFGFRLARMELFSRSKGGAAQLRYADGAGRGLTIFVRPSDGAVQFDIIRRGETHVCVWQDDVVGAVITASVSAAEMLRIASSAYTSLNL